MFTCESTMNAILSTYNMKLTQEQIDEFNREGCIAIPGALSQKQVDALIKRSKELLRDFPLENHPLTKFTTGDTNDSQKHVGDQYFLDSSDKIGFFFEVDAFDANGKLVKAKEQAINKIGHALHTLDEVFKQVTLNQDVAEISKQLGLKSPQVPQSMVICKQPEIGGEVSTHQDGVFLYTEPSSAIGFWYALEDCTKDNGALEYHSGSHKTNGIAKRFVRKFGSDKNNDNVVVGTEFVDMPGVDPVKNPPADEFKLLECPAGTLVLIHSQVLHRSNKNLSNKSRYAYTFHVIDGTLEYDKYNWLQVPPSGGREFPTLP